MWLDVQQRVLRGMKKHLRLLSRRRSVIEHDRCHFVELVFFKRFYLFFGFFSSFVMTGGVFWIFEQKHMKLSQKDPQKVVSCLIPTAIGVQVIVIIECIQFGQSRTMCAERVGHGAIRLYGHASQ